MYCDHCGTEVQDRQQFCGSCGKPVVAPAAGPTRTGRVANNLTVLGVLWIVYSAMHLMGGVFLAGTLPMLRGMPGHWMGRTAALDWSPAHAFLSGSLFPLLGGAMVLVSALGIVAGLGLLIRKPWARMMAIVFGCFALLSFPFGTALGIYTLWVLASADSARQYRQAV